MSYMGGIRRGGGVNITGGPPCQDQGIPSFVNNFNCQLSGQLIWWSQKLSLPLWCNLFNRGGPSRLHPALYFFIRIPKINVGICLLSKRLFLYLYMITILYLTLPLIVYNLYTYLSGPVRRMYDWTLNFLEL